MINARFDWYGNGPNQQFIYLVDDQPANGWHYFIPTSIGHYVNGMAHNETGPACVYSSGKLGWFINNQIINCSTQQEFLQLIKLKVFW